MCGRHLKVSLEHFLITHFVSPNGVDNDALCFTEGVAASIDRNKMVRIVARGMKRLFFLDKGAKPTCWYLDHFGPEIHQPFFFFGAQEPFGIWQGGELV